MMGRILLSTASMMIRLSAALFLLALAAVSCHSKEPQSPTPGLTGTVEPPKGADLGRGASRVRAEGPYNMYVGEPVRQVCSGSVPFFEFDSAAMRDEDHPSMRALADCMLKGPLVGKSIMLIGHTDPRGTVGYNEKLGYERAERVKSYLVGRGIESERIRVSSVGEDSASLSPKDWPKDRRVEVELFP